MKKIIETIKRKWAEYLLEIIVIVGSILGAFALEQWGDERKNMQERKGLLIGLHSELLENKTQLKLSLRDKHLAKDNFEQLIDQFNTPTPNLPYDTLRNLILSAGGATYTTFDPQLGILKTIISSGKINLINNNKIIKFIAQFEDLVKDAQEDTNINIKNWNEKISDLIIKYTPVYVDKDNRLYSSKFENDFKGLFDDKFFYGNLLFQHMIISNNILEEQAILEKLNNVISLIEVELKNKNIGSN